MAKITDIGGKEHEIECIACAIQSGEIDLPVERIAETKNFVVEQDFEWPIEGFLIIVSKRHIHSIDELSDEELLEFTGLLKKIRGILRKILKISFVTLVQEENSKTSHFHFWLFPWYSWMLKKWNGKVGEIKDVMKYAKQEMFGEEELSRIKEIAVKLRQELQEV